jgi:flavin reductase (DIM6/NTAB) family NADH-FMN oxidoreductase RutF
LLNRDNLKMICNLVPLGNMGGGTAFGASYPSACYAFSRGGHVREDTRDTIETAEASWVDVYRRLTEAVIPRPIALVATVDPEGAVNVAPFSFFTVVSSNPPFIAFSPHRMGRTGRKKDTLRNIEQVGDFTVSVVTEEIAERVNACAAPLPYGESEFEHSGLTPVAASRVKAPLVAESPVAMECVLEEIRTYGEEGGAGSLVVGRVVLIHIDSAVRNTADGSIVAERLRAVGRMGGSLWCRTHDTFPLDRPS